LVMMGAALDRYLQERNSGLVMKPMYLNK